VWRAVSFLVDPPLLLADGELFARALPEGAQGRGALVAGALTTGVFWAAAAAFWVDHPAVAPARKAFGYRSGREFMLRYPLPERARRRRRRDRREDAVALAALAAYPLWWWLGWDHGRRARPRGA
jgi:hypothetical protein